MPSDVAKRAIETIADHIELAKSFVGGMAQVEFLDDLRTIYAVTRCLEIISEASRRLPDDLKARYPSVPWVKVAGSGNIYRHDYENVLAEEVWRTVHGGFDALSVAMQKELGD